MVDKKQWSGNDAVHTAGTDGDKCWWRRELCTANTGPRQGVAPATHLRNQQRLREALGCVRWQREVAG